MTPRAQSPAAPTGTITPPGVTPSDSCHPVPNPHKRTLLWDWTSVRDKIPVPNIPESSPILACHNWNTWAPPGLPANVPFRPMFRGLEQLQHPEFDYALSQPYPIMHFLNEPERAGIRPEQAVELWFEKIVPLRKEKGTKVVSPATASDPGGTQWLDTFLSQVQARDANEIPDFLGLHYYGHNTAGAVAYLEERHKEWPSMPVNVSELACVSRDYGEVEKFTYEVAGWCDWQPWISEYGFFGMMTHCADDFVSPAAQLMDEKGGLTKLGEWVVGV